MVFYLMGRELEKELRNRYKKDIQTEEDLKKELFFYGKTYKGDFETQKKKMKGFWKNERRCNYARI